jgi:hypothetical protein
VRKDFMIDAYQVLGVALCRRHFADRRLPDDAQMAESSEAIAHSLGEMAVGRVHDRTVRTAPPAQDAPAR